jgi:opacity protein-like surface antigen
MKKLLTVLSLALLLSACASAPHMAAPTALRAPTPIMGNTGKYMSPYTEDGTVAVWVEKGRAASAGAGVGAFLGAQAGQKLTENIPFVGGMLGKSIGESAGRAIALKMVGGEEFIRANSDLSFNSVQDLAVYMYVKNSSHKDFADALKLTQDIYPELKQAYYPAIIAASTGVN